MYISVHFIQFYTILMYICYIFHLSDWTSTVRLLLVRIQFLVVPGHRTTVNVEPWSGRRFESDADLILSYIFFINVYPTNLLNILCCDSIYFRIYLLLQEFHLSARHYMLWSLSVLTGALTLHVVVLVCVNWSYNITCCGPCLC